MPLELTLIQEDVNRSEIGQRALALLNEGAVAGTAALCDEGLQKDPTDACLWTLRAVMLARQSRYEDALVVLAAFRGACPSAYAAYFNTGKILSQLGRPAEAIPMFQRCVELIPQAPEAHFLLGLAIHRSQTSSPVHFNASREHFRIACELKPDWAEAHYYHGMVSSHSSREDEAELALRKALSLKPDWAGAHYFLAQVQLEKDDPAQAIASLERTIQLVPRHDGAKDWLAKLLSTTPDSRREPLSRYPRDAAEFSDLGNILSKYILTEFPNPEPFITPRTRVFTLGSCFPENIAKGLQRYGVAAEYIHYAEEINSTFANLCFFEWLQGKRDAHADTFEKYFGVEARQRIFNSVRSADIVILSLGVAPCFFDRQTGEYVSTLGSNLHITLRLKELAFRTTTVSENLANLQAIVESLRRLNPDIRIVLMVSPVPLKATSERPSPIVADCVSKSILRVTLHEYMQSHPEKVLYWPSFELVRWLGGHVGQVFGNDDGSTLHVSEQLVNAIIESFIHTFGDIEIKARVDAVHGLGQTIATS